jgi:hypothetical protein
VVGPRVPATGIRRSPGPGIAHRAARVIEIGARRRNQPAPPHAVFAALTDPDRDPTRPWLRLLADEQRPVVLEVEEPVLVVWSSLWPHRPDARIRFELPGTRVAPARTCAGCCSWPSPCPTPHSPGTCASG